jgi:hypothetical protein
MRYFLSAAVGAAAICGISISAATAEPTHYAGGPLQEQGFCWTTTNGDQGYGLLDALPADGANRAPQKKVATASSLERTQSSSEG